MKEKEIPSLLMAVYNRKIDAIRELKEKIEVLANRIYDESIRLMDESGKFECETRDFDDGFKKAFLSHNDALHIPRGNRAYVIVTKFPFNYLIENKGMMRVITFSIDDSVYKQFKKVCPSVMSDYKEFKELVKRFYKMNHAMISFWRTVKEKWGINFRPIYKRFYEKLLND